MKIHDRLWNFDKELAEKFLSVARIDDLISHNPDMDTDERDFLLQKINELNERITKELRIKEDPEEDFVTFGAFNFLKVSRTHALQNLTDLLCIEILERCEEVAGGLDKGVCQVRGGDGPVDGAVGQVPEGHESICY